MNLQSISSLPAAASSLLAAVGNTGSSGTTSATSGTDFKSILADFEKEAKKTPAERAHDEVLKKHGISEDQYKQLPASEKDGIDQEVAAAVRRTMPSGQKPSQAQSPGFSAAQLGLV